MFIGWFLGCSGSLGDSSIEEIQETSLLEVAIEERVLLTQELSSATMIASINDYLRRKILSYHLLMKNFHLFLRKLLKEKLVQEG